MGDLEKFRDLWYQSVAITPTVFCTRRQHPLHKICPVRLDYERLPEPFRSCIDPDHEGETGDTVKLTPEECFECPEMILNDGICDPI